MRALIQRVSSASVTVGEERISAISSGLLVLLGIAAGDSENDFEFLRKKIPALRIFPDEAGKMNKSVVDMRGELLVVSQFTLCADTRQGNRPSFVSAAAPAVAEKYYEKFLAALRADGLSVSGGRFGADMQVSLVNDGPVTIWLDSKDRA